MVEMNPAVQAAIQQWLTSQRGFLIDAWENYQYMRYLMAPEYQRAGLPEALLFGIMAKESGGKVHAVSRAGASGPLQFMPRPATASAWAATAAASTGASTRSRPRAPTPPTSTSASPSSTATSRFTIAAYNGGEGRAARLYAANGGASFWSPQVQAQMPPETRDYVPAVIAAAWLFLHPKKYGLDFPGSTPRPASSPSRARPRSTS
jgi:membrane-bound lytic murein transglycosylase D